MIKTSESESLHAVISGEMQRQDKVRFFDENDENDDLDFDDLPKIVTNGTRFEGFRIIPKLEVLQESGFFVSTEGKWTVDSKKLAVAKELLHFDKVLRS